MIEIYASNKNLLFFINSSLIEDMMAVLKQKIHGHHQDPPLRLTFPPEAETKLVENKPFLWLS